MTSSKRQHTIGIWFLALGYFLTYIPYSGLTKAVTAGLWHSRVKISGFELLWPAALATAIVEFCFIAAMGWWKHATKKRILLWAIPWPGRTALISGLGYAAIIITTTLAYSLSGVSILLALLLMRSGVLLIAPCIDVLFRKRVRWFSWAGLLLSLAALLCALSSIQDFRIGLAAAPILAAYLAGYAVRLPCMSQAAKTEDKNVKLRYFVDEQLIAMPTLLFFPLLWALFGHSSAALQMRHDFGQFFISNATIPGLTIGACYAALGTFCSFIYLDRRENTFCVPMYSCSSLLSGVIASYGVHFAYHGPLPGNMELLASLFMISALLILSPLHHVPEKLISFFHVLRAKRSSTESWAQSEGGISI